jgi:dTDP-4-amino-4,6-dideoxygalactose transaminase
MSHNQRDRNIPFLDLATPHKELREELCEVFNTALETAGFIGGRMVEEFEQSFANFSDAKHCVGVSSGTDALRFAMIAAGLQSGQIAITVPNTFIATVEAISQAGAVPVFVDVDERTYNMSAPKLDQFLISECDFDASLSKTIHRRTGRIVSCVVPVHLYGQMADMDAIMDLAERYNLVVIEDACQAHGAQYFSSRDDLWHKAGSLGRAAAFSFYPGKNLGACGEGGAVTTNDLELARKARMIRDHGQAEKYYHRIEGYNGRLDAIQAGILQVKLKHLSTWNEQRRHVANRYRKLFSSVEGVGLPCEPSWARAVYHLYVVRVENRQGLQRRLAEANIGTGIHYPVPLHLQEAYNRLGYRPGDFPVAEQAAQEILSLPMFPGLAYNQQHRLTEEVRAFVSPATHTVAATCG